MATDKPLSKDALRRARLFGTCAAFAAIEIVGAPYRVINTLQLRHRGPTSNILLPSRRAEHYLITISAAEMKVKKPMEPVRLRTNALQGRLTLDWHLETIRPLFPYGNPNWCAGQLDAVDSRIRHLFEAHEDVRAQSIYVFVAPTSPAHLSKSVFYEWLIEASEEIGMAMTPHRFRHGIATILVKRSLANIDRVAILLNNTPATVRKNYGYIHRAAVIEETQDELVAEVME